MGILWLSLLVQVMSVHTGYLHYASTAGYYWDSWALSLWLQEQHGFLPAHTELTVFPELTRANLTLGKV